LIKRPSYAINILACVGVFFLLFVRTVVYQYSHFHGLGFADDAFYYFVVAQHIVQDGVSTFDGTTLTNGYHPLWMALLTIQFRTLGQSLLLTRGIEFLLAEASLVFALLLIRLPNLILNIFFTAGFFAIMQRISFNGMETALLVFCFVAFTYVSERHSKETLSGGFIDGVLGAAAIASRIDAVVFVLPQMLLTARSWSRRVVSLGILLVCGIIYGAANRYYFGMPVPISGEVKSLGGLQMNWALFRFMGDLSQPPARLFYATGVLFIIALFLLRKPRPYVNRHVVIAFLLGYLIYSTRLAFLSSWVVWQWYAYPIMIGYIACVPYLLVMFKDGLQNRQVLQQLIPAASLALFVLLLFGLPKGFSHKQPQTGGELPVAGIDLPGAVARGIDGAPIAMGDRAGNFAYHYPGSVNQLEGIMNDNEYFRALQNKRDVKALLCKRNVQFVVAFEPDLTDYKVHLVHTIRPELSQYPAPEIPVLRDDEVARMPDLTPDRPAQGTTFLYVWRLRCGESENAGLGMDTAHTAMR
jgi:hypothetical protein